MLGIARNNDVELIRRTLSGQRDAFGLLVDRYLRFAYAIAYARAHSRTDADDVVQDSFLTAYQQLNTLREPARFSAWLATIVRRLSGKSNQRARLAESAESAAAPSELVHPEHERDELRALIRTEVQALDESDREVILLCYFAGKSAGEIAAALDSTPAAIRKRLQRAREKLGERLLSSIAETSKPNTDANKQIMGVIAAAPTVWNVTTSSTGVLTTGGAFAMKVAAVLAVVLALGGGAYSLRNRSLDANKPSAPTQYAKTSSTSAPRQVPKADTEVATNEADKAADKWVSVAPKYPFRFEAIVLDPNGEIAVDVPVQIRVLERYSPSFNGTDRVIAEASVRSDENGCVVAQLESGPQSDQGYVYIELSAQRDTTGRYTKAMFSQSTTRLYALQLISLGTIRGLVRDALGNPIENARIEPRAYDRPDGQSHMYQWNESGVVTANDGTFRIDHLYAGRWQFQIIADGFAPKLTEFIPTESNLEITLDPGLRLAGTLIDDASGNVAPNVRLQLSSKQMWQERHQSTTDSNGHFTFSSLSSGVYQLNTDDHPHYIALEQSEITVQNSVEDLAIHLETGGIITGQLVDADSQKGIAGTKAVANLTASSQTKHPRNRSEATTDKNGNYQIEGLPSGEYKVMFWSPDALPKATPESIQLMPTTNIAAGKTVELHAHAIDRRNQIRGNVRTIDGKAIQGIYVFAVALDHPEWYDPTIISFNGVRTDEHGTFVIYLPGTSQNTFVIARGLGFATRESGPYIVHGQPDDAINLIAYPVGRILGQVIDSRGARISRARFTYRGSASPLQQTNTKPGSSNSLNRLLERDQLSEDGNFYLTNLPPDTYTFEYKGSSTSATLEQAKTLRSFSISAAPLGSAILSGNVTIKKVAAEDVLIQILGGTEGSSSETKTNAYGNFSQVDMPEGEYNLIINCRDDADGARIVRRSSTKVTLPASGTTTLNTDFATGDCGIEGHIKENGKAVRAEFYMVEALPDDRDETISVTANDKGYYRVTGLRPGEHVIRLMRKAPSDPNQRYETPFKVELQSGQILNHDISFGTGSIVAACSGVRAGFDGRLLIVPGENNTENMTLLGAYSLIEKAIYDKEITTDETLIAKEVPEGPYTVLWATYDAKAETDEARFASTEFIAAIAIVETGQETKMQLSLR
ncbi:MAG: sigma-70 family RNA polymerase sigma factor [Candidatus Hydrogenedentes bacterium]|nr:sigma-70 family RNA polymerase sigma factor [Candidatus Hydrogenedentota bacterium]